MVDLNVPTPGNGIEDTINYMSIPHWTPNLFSNALSPKGGR